MCIAPPPVTMNTCSMPYSTSRSAIQSLSLICVTRSTHSIVPSGGSLRRVRLPRQRQVRRECARSTAHSTQDSSPDRVAQEFHAPDRRARARRAPRDRRSKLLPPTPDYTSHRRAAREQNPQPRHQIARIEIGADRRASALHRDRPPGERVADEITRREMDVEREQWPQARKDARGDDVEPELLAIDSTEHLGGALPFGIGVARNGEVGTAEPVLGDMRHFPRLRAIDCARREIEKALRLFLRCEIERAARSGDDRVEHARRVALVEVGARLGRRMDDVAKFAVGNYGRHHIARHAREKRMRGKVRHAARETVGIARQDDDPHPQRMPRLGHGATLRASTAR